MGLNSKRYAISSSIPGFHFLEGAQKPSDPDLSKRGLKDLFCFNLLKYCDI